MEREEATPLNSLFYFLSSSTVEANCIFHILLIDRSSFVILFDSETSLKILNC